MDAEQLRERVNVVYVQIQENKTMLKEIELKIKEAKLDLACLRQNCPHKNLILRDDGLYGEERSGCRTHGRHGFEWVCHTCDCVVREATLLEIEEYYDAKDKENENR